MKFEELQRDVNLWAAERNLIKPDNVKTQMLKVMEEVGELSGALLKSDQGKVVDGIGDVMVTIIILSAQLGLNPVDCLEVAYNEIKDRKGRTEGGTFVKAPSEVVYYEDTENNLRAFESKKEPLSEKLQDTADWIKIELK